MTALLPAPLHARFTALRRAHFPPERNHLEAHVTLFHALPPSVLAEAQGLLKRLAGLNGPVRARVEGVMSLGQGTAIALSSPAMLALREEIADHFHGAVSAQDSHKPRLHVTIQNKVTAGEAKDLQHELGGKIEPADFAFRGFGLHAYRGGPWELIGEYPFRGH